MAEIADSFESVWHDRTRLYEEVLQLREQLRARERMIEELRGKARLRPTETDSAAAVEGAVRDATGAVATEERQKLIDFLLDALKQVERVPSNGSGPVGQPPDPGAARDGSGDEGRHVFPPVAGGESGAPPDR